MKFPLKINEKHPFFLEIEDADGVFICVTLMRAMAQRIIAALTEQEDAGM